jgi:hypothetical protein
MRLAILLGAMSLTACSYASVEPGHRALRFDPHNGGLKPEI